MDNAAHRFYLRQKGRESDAKAFLGHQYPRNREDLRSRYRFRFGYRWMPVVMSCEIARIEAKFSCSDEIAFLKTDRIR